MASRQTSEYAILMKLGHQVSDTVLQGKIPQPTHINATLGNDTLMPYYFMYSLMHAIQHKRGRGFPEYKRRDNKPIQRHSSDAAFKPAFRYADRNIPSGYDITVREKIGILLHDTEEEFGQSLVGALVVNEAIRHLFGEDAATDTNLLTNKNALLLEPLEHRLNHLSPNDIGKDSVLRALDQLKTDSYFSTTNIRSEYMRIFQALKQFRKYVSERDEYLPASERSTLVQILDSLVSNIGNAIREDLPSESIINRVAKERYDRVGSIIHISNLDVIDDRLVLAGESKFLLAVKRNLYNGYLGEISGFTRSHANLASDKSEDSYLTPWMIKLPESTDTVTNMDLVPNHAISIVRKAGTCVVMAADDAQFLREQKRDYDRLRAAATYLFENLREVVMEHLGYLRKRSSHETSLKSDADVFSILDGKVSELEQRIKSIQDQGLFAKSIRSFRDSIRITQALKEGGIHTIF